jgi:hypothetical protein
MPDVLGSVRAHPVRAAALLGAVVGFANAMATEVGALLHHNRKGAILLLLPEANSGVGVTPSNLALTVFVLFVEIAGSVLVDALIFVVPVALVVGLVRIFKNSRRSSQGPEGQG